MTDLPIYIVSLASDVERRQEITDHMQGHGLAFEFFDAARGRSRLDELGLTVEDDYINRRRGYPLTDGEVGCYLSHYLLWQRCVATNQPMVILEDDSIVQDDLHRVYQRLKDAPYGYIKLEKRSTGKPIDDTWMLLDRNKSGTVGYFIRPQAAQRLLRASDALRLPVDNFIGAIWWHGVYPVGVRKAVVGHSGQWDSNIQNTRKAAESGRKYTLGVRLQRKLHRLAYVLNYKGYLLRQRVCKGARFFQQR